MSEAASISAEDSESLTDGKRQRRNRSIRDAICTSLASKASSAVLQFISLPLAARVMGREEFGIYATVSTAILAVHLMQFGIGPALAKGISMAAAKDNHDREGRLFISGGVLALGLVILGLLLFGAVIEFVPITALFGERYAPFVPQMTSALWTGAFLVAGQIMVGNIDRAREGYMEAALVNGWGAGGNLVAALIVFTLVEKFPSVPFLLMAIFLPNILARLLNLGALLKVRPYLIRGKACLATMKDLFHDGLSFSATLFVVYVVEYGLCALLVGRALGPGDVAIFQVLMSLTTAYVGLLTMVGTPLWAALVDARARGDHDWMVSTTRRYYRYLFFLAGPAFVGMAALGPMILPLWYGDEFQAGHALFAAHGLFLVAIGWRHVNRILMIGLDRLTESVRPILLGLLAGVILGFAGLHLFGLPGLFAGLSLGALAIPGLQLPRQVWRDLAAMES